MLLLIIFSVLLVVAIVFLVLDLNIWWTNIISIICGIAICIFGLGILVCAALIMSVQIPKEHNYQNALYEKQMLEYRLEHIEDNLVGNEVLYSEIIEFNKELRSCKYYSDNLWIGLFFNDKIATIEYIEIER